MDFSGVGYPPPGWFRAKSAQLFEFTGIKRKLLCKRVNVEALGILWVREESARVCA
jgi:hypothetical protein